jgi:C4-dicarboxylate transporter DctM subunit
MILGLLLAMLGLFALGMPIAWAMALASTAYMALGPGIPLQGMVQRLIGGIDSFPLLAIPFFILAGNLMNTGGITSRLVTFAKALVGHIKGGFGHVAVVSNMITAGMSGSGVADAAGTGIVLIPAMQKAGYSSAFASAVVGASATIGPIIPPSIPFVVYGSIASVSTGRLLLAGAVPGVVMGICLMVAVYFIARRRDYPSERRVRWRELVRSAIAVLPPLGMPLIIVGGMVGGIMTPTESAVAGAFYAFVLGFFFYREITLASLPGILVETVIGTAAIVIIIAASQPFGWILSYDGAPIRFVEAIKEWNLSAWQLLLLINGVVLVVGCFMEGLAILVMVTPVLMPLLAHAGIDPIHFGVVFVLNIMIGNITPPVGMIMYVVTVLGKISIAEFTREIWPFFLALIVALLLITYIPSLSMWLPDLLLPAK